MFDGLNNVKVCGRMGKKRHELPFNTDGLVIKVNNHAQYVDLGIVGKTAACSSSIQICSRAGNNRSKRYCDKASVARVRPPVAVFDPVVVAGSTVQHAKRTMPMKLRD